MSNKVVNINNLDSILADNMGLVVRIAKSFKPRNEHEFDTYVQCGRIGLWKAAKKYDPTRSKFCTAAWHYIRFEILREIYSHKSKTDTVSYTHDNMAENDDGINIWEYMPSDLSDNEKKVLIQRLQGHTFLDIGKSLGFSRCWANNTYKSAIKKMKVANGT